MKKNAFLNVLLFVLPLLVVFVASSASGLLVYDGENTTQSTWFYLVETSPVGWCAALAGLLNYVLFALAVIQKFVKKSWCVKGIRNIACIAGSLVVLPNMVSADVMVLPNVFGALFLFADAIAAHFVLKSHTEKKDKNPNGKRLNAR